MIVKCLLGLRAVNKKKKKKKKVSTAKPMIADLVE
jgi:hypothetical protein